MMGRRDVEAGGAPGAIAREEAPDLERFLKTGPVEGFKGELLSGIKERARVPYPAKSRSQERATFVEIRKGVAEAGKPKDL
jgi:hypothetical protein